MYENKVDIFLIHTTGLVTIYWQNRWTKYSYIAGLNTDVDVLVEERLVQLIVLKQTVTRTKPKYCDSKTLHTAQQISPRAPMMAKVLIISTPPPILSPLSRWQSISFCTCTKFGPDPMGFSGVIPQKRLIFWTPKVIMAFSRQKALNIITSS